MHRFACDAMLGGLARWLRAAGHDAWWHATVEDWELIRLARREQRLMLTSDTGILKIGIVRDGEVPALLVPHGRRLREQFAFVVSQLQLELGEPRCMACGGVLAEVPRDTVRDRIPPRTLAWLDRYWQCQTCGQLFWQGTHWQRIQSQLNEVVRPCPSTPP
jgi:uncharacterized protein with PIN domain